MRHRSPIFQVVSNHYPLAAGLKLTHVEKNAVLLVDAGDTLAIVVQTKSIQIPGKESKTLFAEACEDVAWNPDSEKYLRGTINGKPVQMLIDTGSDRTIVAARVMRKACIDPSAKVPIQCVHGDVCSYPTATVIN